jgi:hypothetical protein
MLQGLYTLSGKGWPYLQTTAPILGFWHTFKMAHILVHRHNANSFLAPLFHHIVPGHEFFPQPSRLIQIQEVFTNLRLAFDDDVQKSLRRAMNDDRMSTEFKAILQNLKDLIQFFIPVVRIQCVVFFDCDCITEGVFLALCSSCCLMLLEYSDPAHRYKTTEWLSN